MTDRRIADARRKAIRTTICTPTYLMGKKSSKSPRIIGAFIFCMFLMTTLTFFASVYYLFSFCDTVNKLVIGTKYIFASVVVFIIFFSVVCLFMVDVFSSIEERLGKLEEYGESLDENLISLNVMAHKKMKEEKHRDVKLRGTGRLKI